MCKKIVFLSFFIINFSLTSHSIRIDFSPQLHTDDFRNSHVQKTINVNFQEIDFDLTPEQLVNEIFQDLKIKEGINNYIKELKWLGSNPNLIINFNNIQTSHHITAVEKIMDVMSDDNDVKNIACSLVTNSNSYNGLWFYAHGDASENIQQLVQNYLNGRKFFYFG